MNKIQQMIREYNGQLVERTRSTNFETGVHIVCKVLIIAGMIILMTSWR